MRLPMSATQSRCHEIVMESARQNNHGQSFMGSKYGAARGAALRGYAMPGRGRARRRDGRRSEITVRQLLQGYSNC